MGKQIDLPTDLAVAYEVPADATLTDLADIKTDAHAKASALLENPDATAADVDLANRYLDAAATIDGRTAELVQAQEEHQKRINDAKARLETPPEAGTDDPDSGTDGGGGGAVVTAGTPDAPAAQTTIGSEPVLVAAGGMATVPDPGLTVTRRRGSAVAAAASAGNRPAMVDRPQAKPAYLTAAATGAEIDWADFGKAALEQFKNLPQPRPGQQRSQSPQTRRPIGQVHILTHDDALVASSGPNQEFADGAAAIDWAVSHRRLAKEYGQAEEDVLLAAGGWCAPSETLYDLLDITTDDGMLDVPGITVTRGGVRYALGPDFTAVYSTNNANFTRTESQTIAGTPTKPMVNIPCPAFTDNRMVVDGLFLTGDILSSRGYPEAYTDYTQKAMKAFAHFVNAASIADIVTIAGAAVDLSVSTGTAPVTNRSGSATVELLGVVELAVTDMRYKNRLSMTQMVEVILPFWVRGNLRSDIAKRQGYENAMLVSDADIRAWFLLRGAAIQFVYDWQDAFTGVAAGFGAATAVTGWPTTVEMLIYPEGSIVRALDPVIELNAVYDSTLLETNQYVALFVEQGRLTLKRHWDVRRYKVAVAPLGGTSAGTPVGAAGQTLAGNVV